MNTIKIEANTTINRFQFWTTEVLNIYVLTVKKEKRITSLPINTDKFSLLIYCS